MDWLLVVALGIIWAALLLSGRRGRRGRVTRGDFSVFTEPGRHVLMPRRGARFLGPRRRARERVRERRRRVLTVLLEGIGLTVLIGLFPPLRAMWVVTAILVVMLAAYVWLLLQLREAATVAAEGLGEEEPELFAEPEFPVVERDGERHVVVVPVGDDRPARVAG